MTRDGERLVEKIRAQGCPLPARVEFRRTYAGSAQRSAGAWAWFLIDADTGREAFVGSQWPRSALRGRITVTPTVAGSSMDWFVDPGSDPTKIG